MGRFGDRSPVLSVEVSLRGLPRPLAGEVAAASLTTEVFFGRPRPRAGDVWTDLSSEESLRGRPRPRLGDTVEAESVLPSMAEGGI